jgi:transcriptional regulator with XRE-family HTH domain
MGLTKRAAAADKADIPVDTNKIRELRERLGLTQEAAARRAGLRGAAVWNDIEKGRRANLTVATLERVAQALGTHARELLK